jgi:HEAT repeat protein
VSIDTVIPQLQDEAHHLTVGELATLSGIPDDERTRFLDVWRSLSVQRRRNVIDWLSDLAEDNVELDFARVFMIGLFDDDVQVRADSIQALWEYEGEDLPPVLLRLLADSEAMVRSEAALGLGRILLRAELDDDENERTVEIERALRTVLHDYAELSEVRGRALEAVGVRGHEWVRDEIDEAYSSGDRRMQISAVHAMGRNADLDWLPTVIEEMHSDDGEMRYEAAVAAGSIADEEAIADLTALIQDEDSEVQEAAIAALGQIGGAAAREVLRAIASESQDERVLEVVSDALQEADFVEDPLGITVNLQRSVDEDTGEQDWEAEDYEPQEDRD